MNITRLEKSKRAERAAKANLHKLQAELDQAKKELVENPKNEAVGTKVLRLDYQIEAARTGVEIAMANLKAEQQRMNSPEAAKELKQLDKLNNDMKSKQDEIAASIIAMNSMYDELIALHDQAKVISRKYDLKPYNWERGGFLKVRNIILQWVHMKRSKERRAEIEAQGGQRVTRVKYKDTKERKAMIKKRYNAE